MFLLLSQLVVGHSEEKAQRVTGNVAMAERVMPLHRFRAIAA
jgi:hypothetical protein